MNTTQVSPSECVHPPAPHAVPLCPHRRTPQPLSAVREPSALLKIDTILALTGWSRATLYRRIADGTFPSPVKLNGHMVRWQAHAVHQYLCEIGGEPASGVQP